jgi:uncharacterized protein
VDVISIFIVVLAGFFLGVFGAIIGSTLLILTPLLNILGLPLHISLGTAKISVLTRELIPIFKFNQKKLINFKLIMPFTIAAAVFAFIGTIIVLNLNENILSMIIGIFMICISLMIFLKPDIGLKEKKVDFSNKQLVLNIVLGSLIGFYQGIFGGGSNVLVIFSFVWIFGNSFLKAVANSKLPNLVAALVSSLIFIVNGYVNWEYAIPLMISTGIGSYFGAKLAIKKGNKFIRVLFVGLVVIMAIKMMV